MTIRTRLTLWNAVVLLASVLLITVLSINELNEHHKSPNRRSQRGKLEMLEIVLWIGVPTIVLSIGGGWWLMRKALAPLAALTKAAERRNESNLREQIPRTGNRDELDRVIEVLNAMNSRLNDSFSRIREFTLHASHELKTPLTILSGETETELRDDHLSAAQRERAASRLDELRRLSRIVDGLTLLTKADAGLVTFTFQIIRLDELVQDVFADAQILAEAPEISVQLTVCHEVAIQGDKHRLRQLLLNLVDNAIKYNNPRGWVALSLRRQGSSAEFTISNSGPGIAPTLLPRVFDRFFRGDAAHSSEVPGCGLGLSIAQWIATAHHGSIEIASEPAKSTTIIVRLPAVEGKINAESACYPQIIHDSGSHLFV